MPKRLTIDPLDVHLELGCEKLGTDFDINEFQEIPVNELINVDTVIAERWLEDMPFLNDDFQPSSGDAAYGPLKRPFKGTMDVADICGPLEFMVLQLKFNTNTK